MTSDLSLSPLGDRAVLAILGREISEETNRTVQQACSFLESLDAPGILEAQPAYSSFAVHFDPETTDSGTVMSLMRDALDAVGAPGAAHAPLTARPGRGRLVQIPVVYGGEQGPDLKWAAERLKLPCDEIVRIHSSKDYPVHMVGFTPGFPYLAGLDERIALPRLPEPRKRVPAGSVGIAGTQTGVYPWESPGGWRIIGRAFETFFSPYSADPSLLHPGDRVRFVPAPAPPEPFAAPESPVGPLATSPEDSYPAVGASPGLSLERAGFMTLVVDEGRLRHRKLGVPVSGAADLYSYRQANRKCGNPAGAAALEITLFGPSLVALQDLTAAIAGAPTPVTLDGQDVDTSGPFYLPEGSVLDIGSMPAGCRAYLAVSGGFAVKMALGSASTYLRGGFGGMDGRRLGTGDVLRVGPPQKRCDSHVEGAIRPPYDRVFSGSGETGLDVIPGPEATAEALKALCSQTYTVRPESDRMGIRLDGPPVMDGPGDILSSPVVPGTIQVPSDGKPLLLLADAQTTGGYRRLAVLTSLSLGVAGQLRPGARIRFSVRADL